MADTIKTDGILRFPETLGKDFPQKSGNAFATGAPHQSLNQEPYVMFLPYKRPIGFSQLASSQGAFSADVFASVPEDSKEYIVLPLPSSALNTKLDAHYRSVDLKQIPAFINTAGGAVDDFMKAAGRQAAGGNFLDYASTLAGISKNVAIDLGKQAGLATFKSLADIVDDGISAAVTSAVGFTENPFTETMFERVGFRDHSFDYEFAPLTEKEAETIDRVVQRFKYHMLPDLANFSNLGQSTTSGEVSEKTKNNGLILSFPYQFIIRYSVEATTFRLMPSVLTSVSVNYGGQDKAPAFYRASNHGKNWPSRINLRLEFQEIVFLSRSRMTTDEKVYTPGPSGTTVKYRF